MVDWVRIEQVFLEASELKGAERSAYLDRTCAENIELRAEVESLLRSEGKGEELFSRTVANLVDSIGEAQQGEYLGPYRIIRTIGEGGMGAVYLAERDDTFRQRVAIKIVRVPGRLALSRFRHERQILATLQHPNIARLLDGGASDRGVPYIAMEYVEGQPIHDYCRAQGLTQAERIRLFLKVCAAVQYAHRFLVIHRDLKPANILVTKDGEPKLLDFGIAKLLDPEQVGATAFQTRTGMQMLTPEYAAPEQVRGEAVTTATDVYALGAILYELLTGRNAQPLTTSSPTEIARVVCEAEPEAPRLGPDLDNILRMALRKEPERRYVSPDAMAEDLRRHLEDMPVVARPDTLRYRAGKFVRRNRLAVFSGAVVFLTLIAGIVGTAWEARRAERRFTQVRRLANRMLFDFDKEIQNVTGTVKARELLVSTALEYLDSLREDARGDTSLESELAEAYEKVGEVQGHAAVPNLGRPADSLKSWDKALEFRTRLAPGNREEEGKLGLLLVKRGYALRATGNTLQAMAEVRRGVALLDAQGASNKDRANAHSLLFDVSFEKGDAVAALAEARLGRSLAEQLNPGSPGPALYRLGAALREAGLLEEAARIHEEAIIAQEGMVTKQPNSSRVKRNLAGAILTAGNVYGHEYFASLGRHEEALKHYRRAVEIITSLRAADPRDAQVQRDYNTMVITLAMATGLWEGKVAEALRMAAEIGPRVDALRTAAPTDAIAIDRAASMHFIYSLLRERAGDHAAALREAQLSVDLEDAFFALDPTSISSVTDGLRSRLQVARLQRKLGNADGARATLAAVAARVEPLEKDKDVNAATIQWRVADYFSERGRIDKDKAYLQRAAALWRAMRDRGVSEAFVAPRLAAAEADLK